MRDGCLPRGFLKSSCLLLAIVLVGVGPLTAQEPARDATAESPLVRAQQLASLSLLKQASEVLLAELNGEQELPPRMRAQLALELADVYRQSDLPAKSFVWAERAIRAIDATPSQNEAWLADARVRGGVLAVQALEAQGETDAAGKQVETLMAVDRQLDPDPLRLLRIRTLQAELARSRRSVDSAKRHRALLSALTTVRRRSRDLESEDSAEWRIRASRFVADVLSSLGKHAAAAEELEWLLARYGENDNPDELDSAGDAGGLDERMVYARIELLGRLAQQRRRAGDSAGQIAALREALSLAAERLPAGDIRSLAQVDALLTTADLKHRLATANRENDLQQAAQWFASAHEDARRVLAALPKLEGVDRDNLTSRTLLANKRQLEAVQAAARAGVALADVKKVGLLDELRQSLSQAVLPEDSRLALVSSALAAEHVAAGDFDQAEPLITQAIQRFRPHRNHQDDLASALVLLAEVRQAQGRLGEAKNLLQEATTAIANNQTAAQPTGPSALAPPTDADLELLGNEGLLGDGAGDAQARARTLAVWIAIHRGRIAAAEGRYMAALEWLDRAQREAIPAEEASRAGDSETDGRLVDDQDTAVALAAALAERGAVYRVLARFEDAQQSCEQAIDLRLAHAAATDPELLPYQLALAGVAAAKRDVPVLRQAVAAARAIVAADPNTRETAQPAPSALLHLEAMSHFLADSASKDDSASRTDSASQNQSAGQDEIAALTIRSGHRQQAEQLWLAALAQQQRQGLLVDQARSRHYLSQIALRDALAVRDGARGDAASAYHQQLTTLEERMARHKQTAAELAASQDAYRDELAKYRRSGAEAKQNLYDQLLATRERLNGEAAALAQQGARIEAERKRLNALYLSGDLSSDGANAAAERLADADHQAQQACELLAQVAVYPRLHYAALCNHAEVLRSRAGDDPQLRAAAVAKLRDAVALVETPRLNVGDEAAQAEFFARHGAAFDLLVDWSVADGDPRRALAYADWSRNRTFLDQIRSSEQHTTPTNGSLSSDHSANSYPKLLRYRAIQTKLQSSANVLDERARRELVAEMQVVRAELLADESQTQAMAAAEQNLLVGRLSLDAVDRVIENLLASGDRVLYYYVGQRKSYLFLVGFSPNEVEVVPLTTLAGDGGALAVPAGRGAIDRIAHHYHDVCRSPNKARTLMRGGPAAARLAAEANVVLPPEVRGRLQVLAADPAVQVTVVPDGPLFQLPWPALVLAPASPPKFLIDQAPPLVVAPSLMVREALSRPLSLAGSIGSLAGSTGAPKQLLSLARPVYLTKEQLSAAPAGTAAARYHSLGGPVQDLAYAQVESDSICAGIRPDARRQLLGAEATEAALRQALKSDRPRILHLATHGVASNASGAIQGALALSPASEAVEFGGDSSTDGFLELSEIADLALSDCELAVLSACQTNTGAERPLEMGTSFARAFLAAGARRVAATRWQVDDESAASLVDYFFRGITAPATDSGVNTSASYSRAMHHARQEIRRNPDWDTPYHWAVFTLLGGQ